MAYRPPGAESEEKPMEDGFRDEQARHSVEPTAGSVEEQLETIQDDVNLLKIEIKQTLVDLREFILNSQNGFLPRGPEGNPSLNQTLDDQIGSGSAISLGNSEESGRDSGQASSQGRDAGSTLRNDSSPEVHNPVESGGPIGRDSQEDSPGTSLSGSAKPNHGKTLGEDRQNGGINVEMLVKLLSWLDSIEGKGLSPEQVSPFLQAYEARGSITSSMNTLILQSISAVGRAANHGGDTVCSSEEYMGYLKELHDIVCGAGYQQTPTSSPSPTSVRRVTASQVEQA